MLGIVKITVKLELPAAGGLYRFSNMTYRGVQVGKVTAMDVPRNAATATLALNTTPKIPADLVSAVRSASAVGEQYVRLLPSYGLTALLSGWLRNLFARHQDSPTGQADARSSQHPGRVQRLQ